MQQWLYCDAAVRCVALKPEGPRVCECKWLFAFLCLHLHPIIAFIIGEAECRRKQVQGPGVAKE